MKLKVLVGLIAALGSVAWSQAVPAGAGSDGQYLGVVEGTDVYVRHNASMAAYPCAKLSRPQQVTVVGERNDWIMILPPPGVFSVVSKQYVNPDAEGRTGVVTGDRVWVRAGGDLRQTNFTGLQKQLNTGDKVRILGEVDTWYKIAPPEGVRLFISKLYVKPVEASGPAPTVKIVDQKPKDKPEAAAPAVEATEMQAVDVPAIAASAPATPDVPTVETGTSEDVLTDALAKFRAVEQQLIEEFKKPSDNRDLPGLIDNFRALDTPPESHLQPYIDYYVEYVKVAIAKESAREKFEALLKATTASQVQYEIRRTEIEVRDMSARGTVFAGQGVLAKSAIFVGELGTPKRFLLRDPKTGAITAYVEATPAGVELTGHVGKNVGVFGPVTYAPDLQTNIIEVQQIVVLGDGSIPEPPKAKIAPLPPPRPAPKVTPPPAPTAPVRGPVPLTSPKPRPEPGPAEATPEEPASEPKLVPVPVVETLPEPAPVVDEQPPLQPTVKPMQPIIEEPAPITELTPVVDEQPPALEPTVKPMQPIIEEPAPITELTPVVDEQPPALEPTVKPMQPIIEEPAPITEPTPVVDEQPPALEPTVKPMQPIIEEPAPIAGGMGPPPSAEPVKVTPRPAPTAIPAPEPVTRLEPLPRLTPAPAAPELVGTPLVKVRPASTRPAAIPAGPLISPTTRPVAASPVPPSGLPVAKPVRVEEPIDEEEYD